MTKEEATKVRRGDHLIYHSDNPSDSPTTREIEVKVTNIFVYDGEVCKFDAEVVNFEGEGLISVCAPVVCFSSL